MRNRLPGNIAGFYTLGPLESAELSPWLSHMTQLSLSLFPLPVVVIKYPEKSNLRKKALILDRSSRQQGLAPASHSYIRSQKKAAMHAAAN